MVQQPWSVRERSLVTEFSPLLAAGWLLPQLPLIITQHHHHHQPQPLLGHLLRSRGCVCLTSWTARPAGAAAAGHTAGCLPIRPRQDGYVLGCLARCVRGLPSLAHATVGVSRSRHQRSPNVRNNNAINVATCLQPTCRAPCPLDDCAASTHPPPLPSSLLPPKNHPHALRFCVSCCRFACSESVDCTVTLVASNVVMSGLARLALEKLE